MAVVFRPKMFRQLGMNYMSGQHLWLSTRNIITTHIYQMGIFYGQNWSIYTYFKPGKLHTNFTFLVLMLEVAEFVENFEFAAKQLC